jgi:hypothetical protein
MQLDATPAGVSSNAYVTVEAACELLAGRGQTAPWFDVTMHDPFFVPMSARQAQAIIWATRLLDEQVNWFGQPLTRTQALAFPMTGLVDQFGRWVDQHTIPRFLQLATSLYGLALLRDETDSPTEPPAIARSTPVASTGGRITYRDERAPIPAWQVIPMEIRHILRLYGSCTGSAVVPLRRC